MVFQGSSAAISHTGKVRSNNQDSGYAGSNLFVVADGMGGHAGGDVASSLAIARLERLDRPFESTSAAERALRDAIADAATELIDTVHIRPELAGMGTTVSALVMVDDYAVIAHIGDSRIYLYRDDALTQITTDHTFVQRLVDSGRITPEEARYHPRRSVLMRVLGDMDRRPRARHVHHADAAGRPVAAVLGRPLRRRRRRRTPRRRSALGLAPGRTADNLLKQALDGGAPDNVTIVLVDVGGQHPIFSGTPTIVGSASNPIGHRGAGRPLRAAAAGCTRTGRRRTSRRTSSRRPSSSRSSSKRTAAASRRRRIGWIVGLVLVLGPHRGGAVRRLPMDADALLRRRRRRHRRDLPRHPAGHRPDLAVDAVRRHRHRRSTIALRLQPRDRRAARSRRRRSTTRDAIVDRLSEHRGGRTMSAPPTQHRRRSPPTRRSCARSGASACRRRSATASCSC